jgi:tRNA 2-thiouridine synthesizing protein A
MSHFIDITKEHCPMTFVKVKLALAKIDAGEELDVLLKEGEPLQNVPRSAEEQGFTVFGIEEQGDGNYMVKIRK